MADKKGRRRRQRERERERRQQRRVEDERDDDTLGVAPTPRPAADGRPADDSLPSKRVRYAGFVLAIITVFVGILTFADAFAADRAGVDVVLRIAGGLTLIVTAIGIGIIALVPERVQAWLRRRAER